MVSYWRRRGRGMDEEASYQIQNNRSQVAEGGLVLVAKKCCGNFLPLSTTVSSLFSNKKCVSCVKGSSFLPSFLPLLMCSRAALVVSGFFLVLFFETLICQVNFFVWLLSLYLQSTHMSLYHITFLPRLLRKQFVATAIQVKP